MIVLVVLGNRMNDNGTPSAKMERRLAAAAALCRAVRPDAVIVSGGAANPKAGTTEAAFMRGRLIAEGIPAESIVAEGDSLTTKQNAEYSVPVLAEMNPEVVWLCTSEEHVRRPYLNPVRLFRREMKKKGLSAELRVCTERRLPSA